MAECQVDHSCSILCQGLVRHSSKLRDVESWDLQDHPVFIQTCLRHFKTCHYLRLCFKDVQRHFETYNGMGIWKYIGDPQADDANPGRRHESATCLWCEESTWCRPFGSNLDPIRIHWFHWCRICMSFEAKFLTLSGSSCWKQMKWRSRSSWQHLESLWTADTCQKHHVSRCEWTVANLDRYIMIYFYQIHSKPF